MTEPAHAPGWYPDPWKQAQLRWHDGNDWTGHVNGGDATGQQAATQPGAAQAAAPHLQSLPTPMPAQQSGTSGMAIASLVTALIGIWILPLVFGIIALRRIKAAGGALGGRGLAIAGIVIGSIQLVLIPMILLAVAIPTFLAQKDNALATQAKANTKQVVGAVETCAAGNLDGTYRGCDAAAVGELEPSLAPLLERCGSLGGSCIELTPDAKGYTVTTKGAKGETQGSTYTYSLDGDGTVSKTCSGAGCPTGRW